MCHYSEFFFSAGIPGNYYNVLYQNHTIILEFYSAQFEVGKHYIQIWALTMVVCLSLAL